MPILWKELYSLDSFIMASPCVQPFFGNKASMFFLSKIAWRLNPAFTTLITTDSMIDCGSLMYFSRHLVSILIIPALLPLRFLVLLQSLLAHFLVPLHHLLLLLCEFSLLSLKLLLSLIYSPRPLEFPSRCISRLLSFKPQLLSVSFSRFRSTIFYIRLCVNSRNMIGEHLSIVVTWVESVAKVLKIVILLIELGGINMNLLDDTGKVILFSNNLVSCLELGELKYSLFVFKFTDIYIGS
jgi:hypothetical protein